MSRKEVFSQQIHVHGLAYTTVTSIYTDGLLSSMYAQGHRDTGEKGTNMMGDPIHVVFKNHSTLEHNNELVILELQKTLGLPVPKKEEKSLPSN